MRILALDVGTKTIGVAVSDELGITANGVKTLKRVTPKGDIQELKELVVEFKPAKILIGLPYNSDGSLSKRGEQILRFSKQIENSLSIPIVYWDESFSTVNAEKYLLEANLSRKKRKKVIDKMAAVYILKEYLDSQI
ncbi:MAG: Holliday junction resolvase RuvX [Thermodesulfobacteriota bacterium]